MCSGHIGIRREIGGMGELGRYVVEKQRSIAYAARVQLTEALDQRREVVLRRPYDREPRRYSTHQPHLLALGARDELAHPSLRVDVQQRCPVLSLSHFILGCHEHVSETEIPTVLDHPQSRLMRPRRSVEALEQTPHGEGRTMRGASDGPRLAVHSARDEHRGSA